ncbi:hypothetical protein B0H13DRAFT_268824 [Mycena leptocephala]|nr:hypothetical protein B0H13DRAFT_268824 [Mycena leptocephala]
MYEADDAGNDERGPLRRSGDSEFDAHSRFMSAVDERETASNFGSESYAPSRNMFDAEGKGAGVGAVLLDKDARAWEIQEGETVEVLKESSARRRWVTLCWILTFWVPNPLLSWCGRMKTCGTRGGRSSHSTYCFGLSVCARRSLLFSWADSFVLPSTYSASLCWRRITSSSAQTTSTQASAGNVVPSKTILKTYGGGSSEIFSRSSSSNNTDQNSHYRDFRFFTNDLRPDWYLNRSLRRLALAHRHLLRALRCVRLLARLARARLLVRTKVPPCLHSDSH